MNLQHHGYRFVYRRGHFGCGYTWVHRAEMFADDIDCTDMNDDEFESFFRAH